MLDFFCPSHAASCLKLPKRAWRIFKFSISIFNEPRVVRAQRETFTWEKLHVSQFTACIKVSRYECMIWDHRKALSMAFILFVYVCAKWKVFFYLFRFSFAEKISLKLNQSDFNCITMRPAMSFIMLPSVINRGFLFASFSLSALSQLWKELAMIFPVKRILLWWTMQNANEILMRFWIACCDEQRDEEAGDLHGHASRKNSYKLSSGMKRLQWEWWRLWKCDLKGF